MNMPGNCLKDLTYAKKQYDTIREALDKVDENGYPSSDNFEIKSKSVNKGENISEQEKKEISEKAKKADTVEDLAKKAKEEIDNKELSERQKDSSSSKEGESKEKSKSKSDNLSDFAQANNAPTLISLDEMSRRRGLFDDSIASEALIGSYDEYQKYVRQYKTEISKTRVLIKKIITQKKLDSIRRGNKQIKQEKTIIPYNGAGSIDVNSQMKLTKKLRGKDPYIGINDFEVYKSKRKYDKDEIIEKTELEESNFVFLIDGSGSMYGRPFDSAFAAACIMYEATRDIKEVNAFIYIMGEPAPTTVAKPGMSTKEISQKLDVVRRINGRGCCDHLVPAIYTSLKDVAEHMGKNSNKTSGFVHVFPITDGGNNDYRLSNMSDLNNAYPNKCVEGLVSKNPYLTFDWLFVDGGWHNYTKPFIDYMKSKGSTQLNYVDGVFSNEDNSVIIGKIVELLTKRIKDSQVEEKVVNGVKKKILEEGLKNIKTRHDKEFDY